MVAFLLGLFSMRRHFAPVGGIFNNIADNVKSFGLTSFGQTNQCNCFVVVDIYKRRKV